MSIHIFSSITDVVTDAGKVTKITQLVSGHNLETFGLV